MWQTFRGNEWDNKGEKYGAGKDISLEARLLGKKEFYESRGGCESFQFDVYNPALNLHAERGCNLKVFFFWLLAFG